MKIPRFEKTPNPGDIKIFKVQTYNLSVIAISEAVRLIDWLSSAFRSITSRGWKDFLTGPLDGNSGTRGISTGIGKRRSL